MKHILAIILAILAALAIGFWLFSRDAVSPGTGTLTPTPTPLGNIIVTKPRPNDVVGSPIAVEGEARTFEQNVQWRLEDARGNELARGYTTAAAADIGQFGPFSFAVTVPAGAPSALVIKVFESSAQDGSEIHTVSVPVAYRP